MAPPFEILPHPADIGLRAYGATLSELFQNAAAGMLEIGFETATVTPHESRSISTEAPDREALLVNFLQEVLWLVDGEGWLPRRVTIEHISGSEVRARAEGEPRDGARHNIHVIIKAVTYHQLSVRQTAEGWTAEVYVDI